MLLRKKFGGRQPAFFTREQMIKLLVDYHEGKNKRLQRLEKKLSFFVPSADYHYISMLQRYDVIRKDEEQNTIWFQDSCGDCPEQVYVEVAYTYFGKDDVVVEYRDRIAFYGSEVYTFGVVKEAEKRFINGIKIQDEKWMLYTGFRNEYEDFYAGHGILGNGKHEKKPNRKDYDKNLQYRSPAYLTGQGPWPVKMYSDKRLLQTQYGDRDLSEFDCDLLKGFSLDNTLLKTQYQGMGVSISLQQDEKQVKKHIKKAEIVLQSQQYAEWLHQQIQQIYAMYKDWYNDIDSKHAYINDVVKYEEGYRLEGLLVNTDGGMMAFYMDEADSFYGHGICIEVGPRGKVHRFHI